MYRIHLRGTKKAVFLVRANLVGYGEPEILYEAGTDDLYVIHCELATKYDGIPNSNLHREAKEWDGSTVDLSAISMDDILAGKYSFTYDDRALDELSGMFGVDIEILNDPDDKWWEDEEYEEFEDDDEEYGDDEAGEEGEEEDDAEAWGPRPQYPFYAYSNGKEIMDDTLESFDLDVFSF